MNDAESDRSRRVLGEWAREIVARRGVSRDSLGLYVHIPFCATRCGYCDFTTYTAEELGRDAPISRTSYAHTVAQEVRHARSVLGDREIATVFLGGGTPTLVAPRDLARLLDVVRSEFRVVPGAEITIEANPDSVDPASLAALLDAGFTRISFGVQSLAEPVLGVLDRTHEPGRALAAIVEARDAGFTHVSADLIYGTPGESDDDLRRSVAGVLDAGVDHLSAYSLIVEPGTRLAARVARGDVPPPDDDVLAHRYGIVDEAASAAGLRWYEVSNWALPDSECRHNMGYWHGSDWWGCGPGAHSHVEGLRWWNHKHPARYAERIAARQPAVADLEVLTADQRALERLMLGLRVRSGVPVDAVAADRRGEIDTLIAQGLLERDGDTIMVAEGGRLLVDGLIRRLT